MKSADNLFDKHRYAPAFNQEQDPFRAYIDVASRHLKPDGKIVIAIENKVGLKYWNGASEDHLRRPYFGINDLYTDTTATTFSKRELGQLMSGYGFGHQRFLYAFPDYKICDALITEIGENNGDFIASQLLLTSKSRSYGRNHVPSFHDGLASAALEKAGLLGEMANSFVLISSREVLATSNELAFIHNIGKRHESFTCETEFVREEGKVLVKKNRLQTAPTGGFAVGQHTIRHVTADSSYIKGETEATNILRTFVRDPRSTTTVAPFANWAAHLHALSSCNTDGSTKVEDFTLPGIYVDAVPLNFVCRSDGLHLIDTEWQADDNIPLGWTLLRGLRVMLRAGISGVNVEGSTFDGILKELHNSLGLSIDDRSVVRYHRFEKQFRRGAIRGQTSSDQTGTS